jgi:2-methylcitrate dehydratase PrpD
VPQGYASAVTIAEELADFASRLGADDVPARVRAFAKSQLLSQLAAARASLAHPLGAKVVAAFGAPYDPVHPTRAAVSLAALTMCLDFDDTLYAGHVSHSTVNVPVALAPRLALDGRELLASIVAANECAARVTAAATLGPFRGQTAAHAHLAGAVAARLRAERRPPEAFVDAWGLAFALPPWSLERAFLGSDAKLLTAAVPVAAALAACDAAAAGLRGAPDLFEHDRGFLPRFATVPLPDAATAGLGVRWHTETLSIKLYPACAYLDAALDAAAELHERLGVTDPDEVEDVVVVASAFTVGMDARSAPYVCGPASPVSALTFSVPYPVATALLTGGFSPLDLAPPAVGERSRWRLAAKVRTVHDPELTRRALRSTAPVGGALRQAGPRAEAWLRTLGGDAAVGLAAELGPPEQTFEQADKAVGARVVLRLRSGAHAEAARELALGAAGPATRAEHPRLAREKFVRTGGPVEVADAFAELEQLRSDELSELLAVALDAG